MNATANTLRHSTITDLVTGCLPLLTVAQRSGTSAEKIEKHYGHLIPDAAVEALASLALLNLGEVDQFDAGKQSAN